MRHAWLVPLVVVVGVSVPAVAHACKCARPEPTPVRQAFAEAALVVEARVDAHAYVMDRGFVTRLTPKRVFKGAPTKTIEIAAAKTCAVGFTPGTRWLVFAYDDGDGGFTTTYCSRSKPIADATDDLAAIARHGTDAPPTPPLFTPSFAWSHDPFVQLVRLAALALLVTG